MKDIDQRKAAKEFAERWKDKGYEKGESQKYWIDLLSNVLGVDDPINFIEFEDTVHIDKKAINAYRSAREFKIAAENNGRIEFFYKNKHTTIKPCIVNYALSCELFFKSMIIIKNNKLVVKTHKLDDLYEILDNSKIKNELSKYDFDIEIKKISDAFIDWRYCYEHNELTIHTGFLIDLCNCLEKNNRLIILEKYGLNMNESFI